MASEQTAVAPAPVVELRIDAMAQGGAGVGRHAGRVVFAAGGLPGELVRVALSEQKQRYAGGPVVEILSAAPERVAPRLPGADHIPWQHIAYPAQIRFKQAILREQLARLAGLPEIDVAEPLPAARPWGYRNSARLHIAAGRVGYYAAGTHDIFDLAEDPLLLPVLNHALAGLRAALAAAPADDGPPLEYLTGVTLRASASYGYAVAALHARKAGDQQAFIRLADDWRARVPPLAAVGLPHGRPPALHEELAGVVFALTTDSFFQSNTAQAEVLLATVAAGLQLQPGARLLDAYSGAGAFALPLAAAHQLREVVAVEEHPAAVADGEHSAELNNLRTVRFVSGAVERVLSGLTPPFDAAILDPPRRGCHPAALAALVALAPTRVAYVSCHPGILARDLRPLLASGYRLLQVTPVDMFPQTPHVETVAILECMV